VGLSPAAARTQAGKIPSTIFPVRTQGRGGRRSRVAVRREGGVLAKEKRSAGSTMLVCWRDDQRSEEEATGHQAPSDVGVLGEDKTPGTVVAAETSSEGLLP